MCGIAGIYGFKGGADRLREDDLLDTTNGLSPLPLMGVPGWWGGGQDEAFYADKDVFRPPRR